MAAYGQLSRVRRNLGELAAISANAGTHSADWVLGTSINFLIHEEQSVLEAEKRRCEETITALEAAREETAQQLPQLRQRLSELNDALQYGVVNDPVRETLAYLRAVRNGPAPPVTYSPQIHPMRAPILEILLHNLDGVRETVTLRLFEDRFTTECISDGLRKKLRLDANISPRFYIKSINAHRYTNNGTRWELVNTSQPLDRHRRELHVVLRTGPYTLVLLGHERSWKADRTRVLGEENTHQKYFCGIVNFSRTSP
ncbi:hypothetical protein BS47DRAFT_1355724 [Hydnum rufescens UP504]|uniref:Uncharacterized protein n=1 Tax=Hydnum rufescens UP504 TaxID=1448309 RepID=A0A9P6DM64_9AGAM|nr:hypothetical protein BS47DRAFT_1355724 [Hydnum rufescens UP504]